MNEFDQLFFKIWRNKYLNSHIWKLVKHFNFEMVGEVIVGYNEMTDARHFIELKAIQVLKEKVYRKEFIHFPLKLKTEFFYYTRFLDQDFFKTMINNYRIQLISQRNLFQYIIRGGNANALQVFLNEPSSLTRDGDSDSNRPLPKWEFPRNKELGDWAINAGYLSILKCLKENNEISVTTGEKLFDNLVTMYGRSEVDKEGDEYGEGTKSITKVFNYCFDNHFFTLDDFKGTKFRVDDLFSYRFNHSIETLEFIYDIKEYIYFDKSKSMKQFLTVDLFQYSFRKVILILNFYNYLKSLPDVKTTKTTTTTINTIPFIEYSNSDFDIDQPNLLIKDCKLKSVGIIKKFIEIGLRDYSDCLRTCRMVFMYMAHCDQVKEATELLEKIGNNNTPLFEYSCLFCDLSILKQLPNPIPHFSYSLFSCANNQSIKDKIEFLDHSLSKNPMTVLNWVSLYTNLIYSNQVELVQYLLDNCNEYFQKPELYQESYRKFTNDKALFIKGFESFKLIFKYLAGTHAKQILICLIGEVCGSNESTFHVIDWIIQQKDQETDQFYIDRTDPIYVNSIDVNSYSDDIQMLKYLTENGFACTFNGIYSKVITEQRFNLFRYLFENRSEPMDQSSKLLSDCTHWFKLVYYLNIKCNGEFKEQYLKRFPISSHPIIPTDDLLLYYYQTNQMDKFLQSLDSKLVQLQTIDSMNENYKDWETFCENARWLSIDFIDEIFSVLLKYLNFNDSIKRVSYFINPLIYSLVLDSNLPAIQLIFKKWSQIFNDENKVIFDHETLIDNSISLGSIELFNFFYKVAKFPLPSFEGSSFEDVVSNIGIESPILFFLYYSFPNFNYKIPYKNQDEDRETWKADWFHQYVLKNPQIKPKSSDSSDSSDGDNYGDDDGDTTEDEDI